MKLGSTWMWTEGEREAFEVAQICSHAPLSSSYLGRSGHPPLKVFFEHSPKMGIIPVSNWLTHLKHGNVLALVLVGGEIMQGAIDYESIKPTQASNLDIYFAPNEEPRSAIAQAKPPAKQLVTVV